MRIDPKYFNFFIGFCVLITALVIIYSTVRFSERQASDFREKVSSVEADTLAFRSFTTSDSLFVSEIPDQPTIIHFWSTWSDKSQEVNSFLKNYSENHDDLFVIAAAVRDSDEMVRQYMDQYEYPFHFVNGTDLFFELVVPGIPSQIFLNARKKVSDSHIGNDTLEIEQKLNGLLRSE